MGAWQHGPVRVTQGADIKAEDAWTVTTGGEEVIVAVIDTGVEYRHPDLADNVWSGIGWNFAGGNDDPMDYHGHGTHVAGTIAAVGDDGYGVAGVAWDARIMVLKALGDDGRGWTADIAEAVTYASNHGADVINMSLGGESYSQVFYDALAAGPVLGSREAVMLLTDANSVPGYTRSALTANKSKISKVTFFGGDAAVPPGVRATVNSLIK